jgi:hypothetical protein
MSAMRNDEASFESLRKRTKQDVQGSQALVIDLTLQN